MYRQLGFLEQQELQETKAVAGATGTVTAAATSAGLLPVIGATAAIPIVGGIIAGVAGILALFHVGEGCGSKCTVSADTEQIFEVAALDVEKACAAGQISQAQAIAAVQWLQAQGDQQMAQLAASDSSAKAGKANMDKALQSVIVGLQSNSQYPQTATVALNPTQLEGSIFIQPGASGYVASSVTQGASLALQAIADVANVTSSVSAVAASTPATPSGIVAEAESPTGLLVIGGVLVGLYLLTRKN